MNRILSTVLVGAAIAVGGIASADAADLYGRGSMKDTYVPMEAANPAKWYIRGQVGYAFHDRPDMQETACCGSYELSGNHIDDTWTAGFGIGKYFTRNIRADITYDHRWEADARGTGAISLNSIGGTRYFGLTSDVYMANIYYDFDVGRFRPYIGVGLGMAYNKTSSGLVDNPCGCDSEFEGKGKWSVAGALMTGFSVQLKDRLHLDAGYRLMYLGDAKTGGFSGNDGGTPPVVRYSQGVEVSDIFAHELRVGFRYDIK